MKPVSDESVAHYAKFGHLCFALTNTVIWRARDDSTELLVNYEKLILWSRIVHLVTDDEAAQLLNQAESDPDQATSALKYAIYIRELLYDIFFSIAHNEIVIDSHLEQFNTEVSKIFAHARVVKTETGYQLEWTDTDNVLEQVIWPVVRSAVELMTSSDLKRVGVCQGEGCGWLYYDQSRNRSRRWCDMGDCGNRAKAKRFHHRVVSKK